MARTRPLSALHPTERILGNAPAIAALRAQIRHLAPFDAVGQLAVPTVLLQGETGTGKGLVARVLHDSGPRARGPFLDVNCAAIPETLVEAELFGYEGGAFTDARRAKPGLFEAASHGTLFLDEIDALPLTLQAKLLTAIEGRQVRRLGAVEARPVDIKLVAATQAELSHQVAAGRFRADLYHRLAVIVLTLPPLRERGEDSLVLVQQGLRACAEAHRLPPKRLSRAAEAWVRAYDWPGNVRELNHLMERVTLLSTETLIGPEVLDRLCVAPAVGVPPAPIPVEPVLPDEAARLAEALRQTGGNVLRAARLLGLSRDAVRHRLRKYGIPLPSPDLPGLPNAIPRNGAQRPRVIAAPSSDPQGPEPDVGAGDGQSDRGSQQAETGTPTSVPQAIALSWERKAVAVLAVELTWPELPEGESSPYEPWTAAQHLQQTVEEAVRGFGGCLLQRSPSLTLVVFGVPSTLEQLPQRAAHAALALRRLVLNAADPASRPTLRQAVHWGQLLVDTDAGGPEARVLPVGETLAYPVRLLERSGPGEIVASPAISRLLDGWFELRRCGGASEQEVLGQTGLCIVTGLVSQGSALRIGGKRVLSRFVGRAQELAALEHLLRQAGEGSGQVVGIVGEPGVGKSRLCHELINTPLTRGWRVLATGADSYSQTRPYQPFIGLLRSYFRIASVDDASARRHKVAGRLRQLDPSLESSSSAFLTVLDVPVDDEHWQALDPVQRRQRIVEASKRLLIRESQCQPVLLVIDNLHWIDGESQGVLEALVAGLATARMCLLLTYRPEYQHGWGGRSSFTQLRLDPLSRAHVRELLDSLLGTHGTLEPLTQRLLQQTHGNPFFLEESIQTLAETQVLTGKPGEYRLDKPVQAIQVPRTVQAVLAARVDRLPRSAKRLLQGGAVIGQEVPFTLLQAVTALPKAAMQQDLDDLQAAEFLYEQALFPELSYTFKHALTQQVVYDSVGQEQRRALHARTLEAIEGLDPERLAEHVDRLAHHALQAKAWDKAVVYCRQAAVRAVDRGTGRQAVAYFEHAIEALSHVPGTPETQGLAIDLRLDLARPLIRLGEYRRELTVVREAEALARAGGDQARLAHVLAGVAHLLRVASDNVGAVTAGEQALALATAQGNRFLQIVTSFRLEQAAWAVGDYRRAVVLLRCAAEIGDVTTAYADYGTRARGWLARVLGYVGAFDEGRQCGEEALRRASTTAHGDTVILVHGCLGLLALAQGDLEPAIRFLHQGMVMCRTSENRDWKQSITAGLGWAYVLRGCLEEGRALMEESLEESILSGKLNNQAVVLTWLSATCLAVGRVEEARQKAYQALDLTRQSRERGNEAMALRHLGDVHAQIDPAGARRSADYYRTALSLAEELGMRPLQAHCRLGLGTLYAKRGRIHQAHAELSAAIALYRAMNMTFWLSQAEARPAEM